MTISHNLFEKMVSTEHLFFCWDQFKRGKRKRKDIQQFERHLEDNIFGLQEDLMAHRYQHDTYTQFYVTDPKQRHISKATVRDRLAHEVVHSILTEVFDRKFIFHSLSSRLGKGTHIGVKMLRSMINKVSANGTKPCYALKMDIQRFFDTIDHQILKTLIRKILKDTRVLKIVDIVIDGFKAGIPLGNVTSQLFANIYLHELDNFIKHSLREPCYLRYCDDFIILGDSEQHLKSLIVPIQDFLKETLKLQLHPKKLLLSKLNQGIDFVGYLLFSKHTLVRVRTKQRMKKRLKKAHADYLEDKIDRDGLDQRLQSYLGILSHSNQHELSEATKNAYWVRET